MRFPTSTKLSPRQKVMLAHLGKDYTKNRIDFENVIYRDLGDYDIEVSGGHTKNQLIKIYVWKKEEQPFIVERHSHLPQDHELIKRLLDDISERYMNKEDNDHE